MSQFDSNIQARHIQHLSAFLGKSHAAVTALKNSKLQGRRGRLPLKPGYLVEQLEMAVNSKAERCEATDTTFEERFGLACAYQKGLSHVQIARRMQVSREAVRQWSAGLSHPIQLRQLAEVLKVPFEWLRDGGSHHLAANSQVGVRVGIENSTARELLYGLTVSAVGNLSDSLLEPETLTLLEAAVFADPEMSKQARRSGGRWHIQQGVMVFVPWVIAERRGFIRRDWSDEAEAIIAECLATCRSVYAAWHLIRQRCEAAGLAYPSRIALHKRKARQQQRIKKFGIDLNALIADANLKANIA